MNAGKRQWSRAHQSRSFTDRRRRRLAVGLGAVILGAAAWLFVLIRLSAWPSLLIDQVKVYGAAPSETPAVMAAAYDALRGNYLGLFARNNALLYPQNAVAAAVLSASPRVDHVNIGLDGWQTLVVTVADKTPAAIVCADLPDWNDDGSLASSTDCFFADNRGFIFAPAEASLSAAAGELVRYYFPDLSADSAATIGQFATSTPLFDSFQNFLAGVRELGWQIEAWLVKDNGQAELYVNIPNNISKEAPPMTVIYLNNDDLPGELANLTAFAGNLPTDARSTPDHHVTFESIDLRYGNNVFYRLNR